MAETMNYPEILTQVVREEASSYPQNRPIKIASVCDREAGEFLLIEFGRENKRRVDSILFHARLVNGKVIIETDNIEEGLKPRLIEAGISAEDIAFTWNLPKWETMAASA
ncbi:MAG: element excision factor XisI family protein [Blastocatellia bacterium]